MSENNPAKKERELWVDVLRIIATFAVMVAHISAQFWSVGPTQVSWHFFNFYDSAVRWAVNVFFMVSGALFLSRELTINKILKNNVLKMLTAYFFWAVIYAIFDHLDGIDRTTVLGNLFLGHYHMWFAIKVASLYILYPLLKPIASSKKLLQYALVVYFLLIVMPWTILNALPIFSDKIAYVADCFWDKTLFDFELGPVGLFLLGYYLYKYDISEKARKLIYKLGIISFVCIFIFTELYSIKLGEGTTIFYQNHFVGVVFECIAVFTWFKYNIKKFTVLEKYRDRIAEIARCCFGVYMVHCLIVERFQYKGFTTLSYPGVLSVPLNAIFFFALSLIVSFLLNKIKIARKYWV